MWEIEISFVIFALEKGWALAHPLGAVWFNPEDNFLYQWDNDRKEFKSNRRPFSVQKSRGIFFHPSIQTLECVRPS